MMLQPESGSRIVDKQPEVVVELNDGLRARGGFEVDMAWTDGKLVRAAIRSTLGGKCVVRAAVPLAVRSRGSQTPATAPGPSVVGFDTKPGGEYLLAPTP